MNINVAVSDNRAEAGKIPQNDKDTWRVFNGSFQNVTVTLEEFTRRIRAGWAYTAQHSRYRHSKNFLCGQHIALDMDTKDERSTFQALLQDPFIAQYAAFLHTTPSHTAAEPKARVVFALDRPIRDAGKYAELMQALVHRYQIADKACKDAGRFFYGAKGCEVHWLGNVLTLETAARELVRPYRLYLEAERKLAEESQERVIVSSGDVPAAVLKAHSQSLLDRVSSAPDGEKYVTLRNVAITFGGYIRGGYYNESEVMRWLEDAIRRNPNNVQDLKAAFAAIAESIAYGKADPLYFELSQDENGGYQQRLEEVNPPLLPEQRQQVAHIIQEINDKRMWQGYHDGMAQAHRDLWQSYYGLPKDVVDYFGLGFCERYINESTGEIVTDALTVPYRDADGNVVNIEYRMVNGDFAYEIDGHPTLYRTESETTAARALVFDDSMAALTAHLHLGYVSDKRPCTMLGAPHVPLARVTAEDIEIDEVIVIMRPGTQARGRGLDALKDRAKFVRLPFEPEYMIRRGLSRAHFELYLNQARKWS